MKCYATATALLLSTAAAAADSPQLFQVMTTTGASLAAGKRLPAHSFAQHDFVVQLADFKWDAVGESGGLHTVEWRWYRDGQLISKTEKMLDFNSTPYTIWTKRAAATLGGAGLVRIETVLDGAVVAASDVEIKP